MLLLDTSVLCLVVIVLLSLSSLWRKISLFLMFTSLTKYESYDFKKSNFQFGVFVQLIKSYYRYYSLCLTIPTSNTVICWNNFQSLDNPSCSWFFPASCLPALLARLFTAKFLMLQFVHHPATSKYSCYEWPIMLSLMFLHPAFTLNILLKIMLRLLFLRYSTS